jgi:nucleoid DNA-binding protein
MKSIRDKIIKELAEEHNLHPKQVEEIVRSQFEFVRKTIEEGKAEGILLHRLGSFKPDLRKRRYLKKLFKQDDDYEY